MTNLGIKKHTHEGVKRDTTNTIGSIQINSQRDHSRLSGAHAAAHYPRRHKIIIKKEKVLEPST